MIEIDGNGVAREYEWVDGHWVLVEDSSWNDSSALDEMFHESEPPQEGKG